MPERGAKPAARAQDTTETPPAAEEEAPAAADPYARDPYEIETGPDEAEAADVPPQAAPGVPAVPDDGGGTDPYDDDADELD